MSDLYPVRYLAGHFIQNCKTYSRFSYLQVNKSYFKLIMFLARFWSAQWAGAWNMHENHISFRSPITTVLMPSLCSIFSLTKLSSVPHQVLLCFVVLRSLILFWDFQFLSPRSLIQSPSNWSWYDRLIKHLQIPRNISRVPFCCFTTTNTVRN